MKVVTRYFLIFFASGLIFSCRPSKICPAYHSYFILDPDVTRSTFSLFGPDSLPKDPYTELWQIDKKKVGIADDFSRKKKERKQRIITMESIYLDKEDPMDAMAKAEMDSATRDSLQQAQPIRDDDFYNYDQVIYLHHFGKYFPRPKPDPSMSEELKQDKDEPLIKDDEPAEEDKDDGGGFFKNLFGKKKNKDKEEAPPEDTGNGDEQNDDGQ